ncbi:unnamed protein product [Blepharisma stoltei]|uniref:Uncharacterized protein n=1 Tax=Blepharisma stoltei TaxID=1481888 RepID=A0AAU9JXW0_9CILI|nr:unnamed protein product [Blepharisma stoltei]
MKFIVLLFFTEAFAQEKVEGVSDLDYFIMGFYNGLQENPYSPSNCIKSIPAITSAYDTFSTAYSTGESFSVQLHAFKGVSNAFTSTISICNFNALITDIAGTFQISTLKELGIAVLTNVYLYGYLIRQIIIAYLNFMYYDQGYYVGKLLSTSYSFYL